MLAHAAAKYFLFTLPGTATFFAQHGFPGWTAYPVFLVETVGGVLLVLGWQTRWVAVALLASARGPHPFASVPYPPRRRCGTSPAIRFAR